MKMKEIENRLIEGEHIQISGCEIFLSYSGSYWIRRPMTMEEMEKEEFEEQGWQQEYYDQLEDALEAIGYLVPKQISMF